MYLLLFIYLNIDLFIKMLKKIILNKFHRSFIFLEFLYRHLIIIIFMCLKVFILFFIF